MADKLVHASIIDGYKLSGADLARFRHNDMAHLESIIRSKSGRYDRILVVTESVFSMDGDSPDMNALVDIRRRYDEVMLYVDEAHGFAVSGPDGLGLTMALDRPGDVDVIVGTFGKAAASIGAFAVMEESVRSYVVNNARSLIFSTVLPPLNAEWTALSWNVCRRWRSVAGICVRWRNGFTADCAVCCLPIRGSCPGEPYPVCCDR